MEFRGIYPEDAIYGITFRGMQFVSRNRDTRSNETIIQHRLMLLVKQDRFIDVNFDNTLGHKKMILVPDTTIE